MDAPPQRLGSRRPPYASTAAVLLGVVAVSQVVPVAKRAFGGDVPPLFAQLHPSIGAGLVVVAALAAAGWLGLPRLSRLPRAAFLAVLVLFAWTFAVALAASSAKGWSAVSAPFLRPIDYWANVPLVDALGPRAFAEHYPHLAARLSLHATTHPPGAPLFLWALSKVAGAACWWSRSWWRSWAWRPPCPCTRWPARCTANGRPGPRRCCSSALPGFCCTRRRPWTRCS